jgi:6-phosphofructokinase 1
MNLGLVDGGDKIMKLTWGEVRRYISVSGTIIGSARCKAFRTLEGRLKAAENLVLNGIDALIVIGGDGSLTGADLFRSEWPTLLATLVEQSRITQEQADTYKHLNIAGLVGSIDNDMACTDITIGAVSSLHRICESVDNIISTALSHQRAFVIEVMGRHCGWLALMAAVCCGADWVFIPEKPAKHGEWQKQMCETVKHHRELGRRCSIIIVCEGAIDDELNPIKLDDVSNALTEHLQMDSRTTSLGHVQRGGNPSAMDRIVGAVQGVIAVQQILEATPETPSPMIGIVENHFTSTSLMDAVATTKKVTENVEQKNFKEAFALRDPEFIDMWQAYKSGLYVVPESRKEVKKPLRIAIMNIGAPAAGMNAVTKTVVRLALNSGHKPIAIMNGISGLIRGEFKDLNWLQVDNWMNRGGSELGTNRKLPEVDYGMVAYQLQRHGIDALLVVGGFEAYHAVTQLTENRKIYPIFNIPIACVPATISNNVPGTAYSLGSDTSLNAITEACDRITQSAAASHRRVFIVEVQGGRSGYLATMAGLCVGASRVYTPEEGISLKSLQQDVEHMKDKFRGDSIRNDTKYHVGRLILRTETSSKTYTTNLISNVFETESEGLYDSRTAVLGHIQQGGTTAPMDRVRGCRYGYHAFVWLEQMALQNINADGNVYAPFDESSCVIGAVRGQLSYSSISSLQAITDWEFRRPTKNWWDEFPQYNKMLAHYPSSL